MRDIAQFFKVLADETRLRLLWLLLNHPEICVCDLMAVLGMTQSKVSRHLAALRHAGLVRDRKEGTWSYYSMNAVKNEFEQTHLNALRSALASHPDTAQTLLDLADLKKREGRTGSCTTGIVPSPSLPKKLSNRGLASSKGIQR